MCTTTAPVGPWPGSVDGARRRGGGKTVLLRVLVELGVGEDVAAVVDVRLAELAPPVGGRYGMSRASWARR